MRSMVPRATHRRVSIWSTMLLLLLATASTATAQFKPRIIQETTVGDKYKIEGGVDFWFPTAELTVASGGSGALSGIPGTEINAKRDLGLVEKNLPHLTLGYKPGKDTSCACNSCRSSTSRRRSSRGRSTSTASAT